MFVVACFVVVVFFLLYLMSLACNVYLLEMDLKFYILMHFWAV